MCGIFCVFLPSDVSDCQLREKAVQLSRRQRHRGPDSTGVVSDKKYCIVQERLSIIGLSTGKQPLVGCNGQIILAANGEIYNYRELAELIANRRGCVYEPRSDSDVIMALYEEFGVECASMLWGMFGFVIYDARNGSVFAARDGLGVCSLYYGRGKDRRIYIASEMKCIPTAHVDIFPPGCYVYGSPDEDYQVHAYYKPEWLGPCSYTPCNPAQLVQTLSKSVEYHLAADVPIGAFLSGGVDSAIISLIASGIMKASSQTLRTFSVGTADSEDITHSRLLAEYLGTDHTEVIFDPEEEGIDLLPELIWHLETYDVSTIRSAIPMYILSRAARSLGIKVIISGEGADEIFGGYNYFLDVPDADEFGKETTEKLVNVHLADGLRANKTTMAQSVELRAPFLGSPFTNYAMHIDPQDRMPQPREIGQKPITKYLLRKAFDGTDVETGKRLLPEEVVWRPQQPISVGVGHTWVRALTAHADRSVSVAELEEAGERFPVNTPTTKEAYLYRRIFDLEYPGDDRASTVHPWAENSWEYKKGVVVRKGTQGGSLDDALGSPLSRLSTIDNTLTSSSFNDDVDDLVPSL